MPEEEPRAQTEARLEQMLTAYGSFLRGTLRRMLPRGLGISLDELEQEVRVRLWRALESEREIASPSSYLYRIAATATLDAVRRARARQHEVPLEIRIGGESETSVPAAERFPSPGEGPLSAAERSQALETIDRVRRSLPPPRGEAVGLHLQGFTTREIGGILGWTEAKARNLVYRGLADMKAALRSEGVEIEVDDP